MNQWYTAGKLISNEETNLVHMTTSQHAGITFSPFKAKVAWVEETESTILLTYKGHVLKKYSTYNDFYGYDSSRTESIKDAQALIERLGIEPQSGLVMEVRQTIKRTPCELTKEPENGKKLNVRDFGDDIYLDEPSLLAELKKNMEDWQNSDYDRTQEIRQQIQLDTKIVSDDKLVWDSVRGDV